MGPMHQNTNTAVSTAEVRELPPQHPGQARTMLICETKKTVSAEIGHWYSPEKVAELLAEEREACAVAAWMAGMDFHTKVHGMPCDAREVGSAGASAIRMRSNANELVGCNTRKGREMEIDDMWDDDEDRVSVLGERSNKSREVVDTGPIMTEDQIIALADIFGIDPVGYDKCIAFARAIENVEREACAKLHEQRGEKLQR